MRISSLDHRRANSGSFEKFAEDTAERIVENHGAECETAKTARDFLFDVRQLKKEFPPTDENGFTNGEYEDTVADLEKEFLHDILEDYRIMLDQEIEYQNSAEQVDESIRANEYTFTADGRREE